MQFYLVDCFAEEKYQGNQLLVVVADRELTDQEQQNITREVNFSETTFLLSGLPSHTDTELNWMYICQPTENLSYFTMMICHVSADARKQLRYFRQKNCSAAGYRIPLKPSLFFLRYFLW